MPAKTSFLRKYRQLPLTYLNFKTGYRICFRATGCFMTRNLRANSTKLAESWQLSASKACDKLSFRERWSDVFLQCLVEGWTRC